MEDWVGLSCSVIHRHGPNSFVKQNNPSDLERGKYFREGKVSADFNPLPVIKLDSLIDS